MKLHFLGTRGNIEARTAEHSKHSVLAIGYRGRRVIIDCGADWLAEARQWNTEGIVITHAHPDHVDGLRRGAPCKVYATRDTWNLIGHFPIKDRFTVQPRRKLSIAGMTFVAFPVEHSLRAPAVGYRITAGKTTVFYCPDLVYIHDRQAALKGIAAYIGDGATISRSFIHRWGDRLFGHAPVSQQLGWCKGAGVPRALITHCGTEIVAASQAELTTKIALLSRKYGLQVRVAQDGLELTLRQGPQNARVAVARK